MNKFITISIFLIFQLLFSFNSSADTYLECNNCSNYSLVAKNSIATIPGTYYVHVGDFDKENLSSFRVRVIYLGGEPGFPPYIKQVSSIASSSDMQSEFDQFVEARKILKETASNLDVPHDIIDTAWDLYANPQAQDDFFQYVYDNQTMSQQAASLVNFLSGWLIGPISLEISLSDGSTIVLKFDRAEVDADGILLIKYEIDFDASRDINGNPLVMPSSANANSGPASFTNGQMTLNDFLQAAARAGIPITSGGGGGGTGGPVICTMKRNVLTCIYYPK